CLTPQLDISSKEAAVRPSKKKDGPVIFAHEWMVGRRGLEPLTFCVSSGSDRAKPGEYGGSLAPTAPFAPIAPRDCPKNCPNSRSLQQHGWTEKAKRAHEIR